MKKKKKFDQEVKWREVKRSEEKWRREKWSEEKWRKERKGNGTKREEIKSKKKKEMKWSEKKLKENTRHEMIKKIQVWYETQSTVFLNGQKVKHERLIYILFYFILFNYLNLYNLI